MNHDPNVLKHSIELRPDLDKTLTDQTYRMRVGMYPPNVTNFSQGEVFEILAGAGSAGDQTSGR